jgi:hypothetical protein
MQCDNCVTQYERGRDRDAANAPNPEPQLFALAASGNVNRGHLDRGQENEQEAIQKNASANAMTVRMVVTETCTWLPKSFGLIQ